METGITINMRSLKESKLYKKGEVVFVDSRRYEVTSTMYLTNEG